MSMEIIKEAISRPTIFKNESPLSIEYIPTRLPHRESQLRFLAQLFRFILERPGSMNQRVLVTGSIGTGKTVMSQRFGLDVMKAAKSRKINLRYIHVNCRECRGSLFMILKRVITEFTPEFPQRGFSSEELIQILMDILDDKDAHVILALDELETLIRTEGSAALYNLTRIQENRLGAPMRLSLICILREPEYLKDLDASTLSTLQQNFIQLERYSSGQLEGILKDRIELAFKEGAVPQDTVKFICDLAAASGDARYAIELLWRAGKYVDAENVREMTAEHIRRAAGAVYPTLRGEYVQTLSLHEKFLLLAISRLLERTATAYISMGEAEKVYKIVCEEYRQLPRAHTQLWKYMGGLDASGIISTKKSGKGLRGKTTLIGLTLTPASAMTRWLESTLEVLYKRVSTRTD